MKTIITVLFSFALAFAQNSVVRNLSCSASTGSTTTYACNIPVSPGAYVSGADYYFQADLQNTGAATINFNSLGAKAIKIGASSDPSAGDIKASQWVHLRYDGTNMQLVGGAGTGGGSYTLPDATASTKGGVIMPSCPSGQHYSSISGGTVQCTVDTGGSGASTSSQLLDFATTKTSATLLSTAAGTFRSGSSTYALGATTFTLSQYSISSISAGSPTTLTLASPLPTAMISDGDTISISGVGGTTGCAAMNGLQSITSWASGFPNLVYIAFNSAGLTCTGGTFGSNPSATGVAYEYLNYDGSVHVELPAAAGLLVAGTGSFVFQQTTTPSFPSGSDPIATISLNGTGNGNWGTVTDKRGFMSNVTIQPGTGISVNEAGGVATVAVDTAIVPRLGQTNVWTGNNNFGAASSVTPTKIGTSLPATCTVGQAYTKTDAATTAQWYLCTSTNNWTAQGSAGSYTLPDATTSVKGGIVATACSAGSHWSSATTGGVAVCTADSGGGGGSFDPMDQTISWFIDDFLYNNSLGVGRGSLQWQLIATIGASAIAILTSEANHNGILQLTTDATSGDNGGLLLSVGSATNWYVPGSTTNWELKAILRVPTITNAGLYWGFVDGAAPAHNFIGLKYDTADSDTTWKCGASQGYSAGYTDTTTTVVAGTWYTLRVWSTVGGTINCSVNAGTTYTFNTSGNIPTVNIFPGVYVVTHTNAARTVDMDWAAGKQTLTR